MRVKFFIFVGIILLFASKHAYAACGLKSCPVDMRRQDIRENSFATVGSMFLFGEYTPGSEKFSYATVSAYTDFRPIDWSRFSVTLPLVSLENNGNRYTGLGDMLLEAAYAPFQWSEHTGMLWTSLQIELPTGDKNEGLGSGHVEFLPYLAVHQVWGNIVSYVQTGLRLSLDDHSHSHAPGVPAHTHSGLEGSPISLHSDKEFTFRTGAVVRPHERIGLEFSLVGNTVLSPDQRGQTFLSLSPQVHWAMTQSFEFQLRAEAPVTSTRRFDWQVGAGLSYNF